LPFIGDTVKLLAEKNGERYNNERHRQYGDIYKTNLFLTPMVAISSPTEVKRLLSSEHVLAEALWPKPMCMLLGGGSLPISPPALHLPLRKALGPLLQPAAIAGHLPDLERIAPVHLTKWAEQKHIKAQEAAKSYTMQVGMELVAGIHEDSVDPAEGEEFVQLFNDWVGGFASPLPLPIPGSAFAKAMKARQILLKKLDGILDTFPQTRHAGARKPTIQLMQELNLENGQRMSRTDLKDNALVIMFAGYLTTASTLMIAMRYLKAFPETLNRLRAEQKQIVAEHGEHLTPAAMKDMRYTEACVKEALRMIPIIGSVCRQLLQDVDVCGYKLTKGTRVVLSLCSVISGDSRWVDKGDMLAPDVYNPDRWLRPEGARGGDWVPFGGGPRWCLGQHLAMQEIKVVLALLARGYNWELDLNEPFTTIPLLKPQNGMPMTVSTVA
jgi:cytochrome P450